ncbi:MAG: cation transporter [Bacteriovoracaceae bacterium]|nr:cation transporter [Bacteriovoracaceae bacterium]
MATEVDISNTKLKHSACEKCIKSLGAINVGGNSFVALVKMYLGIVGGSAALFADGIHSFGDVAGSMTMLVGLKIVNRPNDEKYPYGYGKFEYVSACAIYSLLFGVGVYIFIMAIHLIVLGHAVNPDMVTVIGAMISLVANELMYRQSFCAGNQLHSPSMIANAHEKRADVWSSLAVLLGIVGSKFGLWFFDPLAALLVSGFIFKLSLESIYHAIHGLMDHQLPDEDHEIVLNELSAAEGFEVREVRTRELGQKISVEVELFAPANKALKELDALRKDLTRAILDRIERPGEVLFYFFTKKVKQ